MISHNHQCFKKFLYFRFYSTQSNRVKPLHPWWVTGYTDGEGSFLIGTYSAKTAKIGYTVRLSYQITAHYSDELILYRIKAFFNNVGKIRIIGNYVTYRVENLSDVVNYIIPPFW